MNGVHLEAVDRSAERSHAWLDELAGRKRIPAGEIDDVLRAGPIGALLAEPPL